MITHDRLKHLLTYNCVTGVFTNRVQRNSRSLAGSRCGHVTPAGYIEIRIDGCAYLAHRLAWLYVHGTFPTNQIDHLNGVKNDNRISNLKDVTQQLNQQNQGKAHRDNKSGLLGVCWNEREKAFRAYITVNKNQRIIGRFATKEEASTCYLSAKRELHHATRLFGV